MTEAAKRMAVVLGTAVIDIIVATEDFKYPHHDDAVLVEDDGTAHVGGTYIDGEFAPPPLVVNRQYCASEIDRAVLLVYERQSLLSKEYAEREREARVGKGDMPRMHAYAAAKNVKIKDAIAETIAKADANAEAMAQLADLRMQKNYILREDVSDDEAHEKYLETLGAIESIAQALA